MTATRLLRNKWVLMLGVLAVVGLVAGQSLADPPHHGGYSHGASYRSWSGFRPHWTPSFDHHRPMVRPTCPYYRPPIAVRPPCLPYYRGSYVTFRCTPGISVTIVIR